MQKQSFKNTVIELLCKVNFFSRIIKKFRTCFFVFIFKHLLYSDISFIQHTVHIVFGLPEHFFFRKKTLRYLHNFHCFTTFVVLFAKRIIVANY